MDNNIKKAIILENYQNPYNKGLLKNNDYKIISTKSKSCIDQIDLQVKINNNVIEDIRFDGEACAICTSTTSIMIKKLIGKTLEEALKIINEYESMVNEKEYDEEVLEEANAYCDISKEPNRKTCALLTWVGIKEYIEKIK